MQNSSHEYKLRWEQAISDVDAYFATNSEHAKALAGKSADMDEGKEREVDEVQVALPGTAITLEEKIERFKDKVKTHLEFIEHDFTPIKNKGFKDIYFNSKRTPEEDILVRAATAALTPDQFNNALTNNVKVGDVANQIQQSNLNTVVKQMATIEKQRNRAKFEDALKPQEQKDDIWGDLGHILDKLTNVLTGHKMETGVDKAVRGLSVSPDSTPPASKQGGITPSI
jgi:hypothetical protein